MPLYKFRWEDLDDFKYETIINMPNSSKASYFKDYLQKNYFEVEYFELKECKSF